MERLTPSGRNNRFSGPHASFDAYIAHMRSVISETRCDLTEENHDKIIEANAPFELVPDGTPRAGVLLIHGLLDSPYLLKSLGRFLQTQGFLVRAILLPGHGTRPGDLLDVKTEAWQAAVRYALDDLKKQVANIFALGFSTGAGLALDAAFQGSPLAGLMLLSPALRIRSEFAWASAPLQWLGKYYSGARWQSRFDDRDFSKYESLCFNAIYQVYRLTRFLTLKKELTIPLFVSISDADQVVCPETAMSFFKNQKQKDNRLLLYSANDQNKADDPRILHCDSHHPALNYLDLSHQALPVSPEDPHYGCEGDYVDFKHYQSSFQPGWHPQNGTLYYGETSPNNLKKHYLARTTCNLGFDRLCEEIQCFLNRTLEKIA